MPDDVVLNKILERLDDLLAFSSLALRRHASPQANQGTVKRKG